MLCPSRRWLPPAWRDRAGSRYEDFSLGALTCANLYTRFAPHQVLMGGLIDGINAEIPNSGKGWTKDLLSPIEQGLKAQVRQSDELLRKG